MLMLKPFRDKAAGVADLLNWSHLVDSGIVLCKDGSLLAGWFYRAPDIASSTDAGRNWLIRPSPTLLSRALLPAGPRGSMLCVCPLPATRGTSVRIFPIPSRASWTRNAAHSSCAKAATTRASMRDRHPPLDPGAPSRAENRHPAAYPGWFTMKRPPGLPGRLVTMRIFSGRG